MNRSPEPISIHRSDYQPAPYRMPSIELHFELDAERTVVTATGHYQRAAGRPDGTPLVLDGEDLELLSLEVDGAPWPQERWQQIGDTLTLLGLPADCRITTRVAIAPRQNRQLSGLYASGTMLLTQCEAQGFRRITFAQDRPDVMSRYRVTLSAPARTFPVLLANGNCLEERRDGDRLETVWDDPFPKPSYLFALVAGRLECLETRATTASGRSVLLQIWCEPGQRERCHFALESLQRAIAWDERRYGLELDLDRFMIVAVADFNMGAMENKGLNIFNAKYVFADPGIATDDDYGRIESIVGHEYFHNWTGNRVTCRDWFQLTLKEGLTVYRDQQFTADCMADEVGADTPAAVSARTVNRIENVRVLRALQFAEDAGPMAHPIRPDSYQAIDNFYTATVYEKGAEVIRMMATLVGDAGFRRGMDLYFQRHDGEAVTCDDFVAAIADANQRDLSQFLRWYDTAGTPVIGAELTHDADTAICTLTLTQQLRPPQGARLDSQPLPLHIPVAMGLLDPEGRECHRATLELTEARQQFTFPHMPRRPVVSLLRGFSAPVILQQDLPDEELAFLLRHDTDPFNRWESGQRLMTRHVHLAMAGRETEADATARALIDALKGVLDDPALDAGLRRLLLSVPGEGTLTEDLERIDPGGLRLTRRALLRRLAEQLRGPLQAVLDLRLEHPQPYRPGVAAAAQRGLHNLALQLLAGIGDPGAIEIAVSTARDADNMTDRSAALIALCGTVPELRDRALEEFAQDLADEPTVMDKWFMWQATQHRLEGDGPILERVRRLAQHPAYVATNPNKIRSLVHAFCTGNLAEFHLADGSGYQYWSERVLDLDGVNPQVAARLARALDRWKRFDPDRQERMRTALQGVAREARSPDVREVVQRALAADSAPSH